MDLKFSEWLPDVPDLGNPGLTVAQNVLPGPISYTGMPSLSVASSNALNAMCRGAVVVRDPSGNPYHYAGTATKLYGAQTSDLTFSDLTNASIGTYNLTTDWQWGFCQWGRYLVATNFYDPVQYVEIGGSSAFLSFPSTAPRARYCAVVRDFFVLANTFGGPDGSDEVPYRVWWSGINDFTNFPLPGSDSAQAVLSDYQDLVGDGGPIMGIVGGEFGVIFQEESVTRMNFGGPAYFQFDRVEGGRGTRAPYSIAGVGPGQIFYLGADGFYMFNGYESIPIGAGKVDEFFLNDINSSYLNYLSAAFDKENKIIMWAYASTSSSDGTPDSIIMFSWKYNKWSHARINVEVLAGARSPGTTLEELDALYPSGLDSIPISLDSEVFRGGAPMIGAYGTDHMLYTFTGTDYTATFATGELALLGNRRAIVQKIRPLVSGSAATPTLRIAKRNALHNEASTYGASISLDSIDEFPARSNARYQKFELTITGGFDDANGLDLIEVRDGGRR